MFDIDNHEKDILAVDYKNKTIETNDKWNQLNLIDIQSLLGNNHLLRLSHMAKSYIWIEETNKRINDLYWIYDESKFEYEQSIQIASESMFEKQIFHINRDTNQ